MPQSLTTQARHYIRQFTGPIPRGSMLLVEVGDDLDHLEDHSPDPGCTQIHVFLDRPDDTYDYFDVPLQAGTIPQAALPTPHRRASQEAQARQVIADRLGQGFVTYVEAFAHNTAKQCLGEFLVHTPEQWVWRNARRPKCKVRVSWKSTRQCSYGGSSGVSIALNGIFLLESPGDIFALRWFHEYNHIARDPDIGNFRHRQWKQRLSALIAHEVAHHVQCYGRFSDINDKSAHGRVWQRIYRQLRVSVVRM